MYKKVIKIVEEVLIDFNNDIVNSLKKKDSKAISINTKINNIISVVPEKEELGFVGVPNDINLSIIAKLNILRAQHLRAFLYRTCYNIVLVREREKQVLSSLKKCP